MPLFCGGLPVSCTSIICVSSKCKNMVATDTMSALHKEDTRMMKQNQDERCPFTVLLLSDSSATTEMYVWSFRVDFEVKGFRL